MTVPGNLSSPLLATAAAAAAGAAGPIKSLRFNSADSAYLSRSQSSGNSKTFTYAFWFKAPVSGTWPCIIGADSSSNERAHFRWNGTQLQCYFISGGSQVLNLQTNRVFRDKSAWYHIVLAFDTTQSTASDRAKLYVNGTQESSFAYSTYPSQNATVPINNSSSTAVIGRRNYDASNYFNGYLADIYFIDGSALDPTSFGAYDDNGVWQASTYSGTFGTNGFHLLDFANESTVGHDSSGNENDFAANNITTGNTFSTNMTPSSTAYPNTTLSNGGLSWSGSTANDTGTVSSLTIPTNKKTYVEVTHTTTGGGNPGPGVAQGPTVELGLDSVKAWWRGGTDGSASSSTLGSFSGTNTSWSNGDVLGIALDNTANSGAGSITFYKNGTQTHTGGSGWTSYTDLRFEWQNNGSGTSSGTWNYGASAFSYPVSGHTGLFEGSGADEDVLRDVPTNGSADDDTGAGGEVSGNYPTWNPLDNGGSLTLSNGNLNAENTGGAHNACRATVKFPPTGKWYYEAEITTLGGACCIGVENSTRVDPELAQSGTFFILVNSGGSVQKYNQSGVTNMSGMGTPAVGGILQVAYDADADKVWFGLNNNWMGSGSSANGNPSAGTEASISNISDPFPVTNQSTSACAANFGQRSFAYSAPTNFKPLCTTLLPTPTIADGSDHFDALLYTGTGANQSISGLSFGSAPDFVWIKRRNGSGQHVLTDSVRGTNKQLFSSLTNAEQTSTTGITSFDSNGFSLGTNVSPTGSTNGSSSTYAAWCWNAGANSNKTYTVTVVSDSGNKYRFDGHGTSAVTLDLAEGSTYVFDQSDSSNSGHPLRFSTTSNGSHGGGSEYTTGVTATGTPGSAGAKTTIVVAAGAPTLYYYCTAHSGMGGQVNTNSTAGSTSLSGEFNSSVYNQSQNWSSNYSSSNGFAGAAANAFDGNVSTESYASANGGVLTMTFSPSLSGEIVMDVPNGGTFKNSSTDATIGSFSGGIWTYTASNLPGIKIEQTGGRPNPRQVKLDGKILVDSTATPPGVPSLNSVVKANPEAGFSVVSWTGTGANATIAHGLNAPVELIISKNRDASSHWQVFHTDVPNNKFVELSSTGGTYTNPNVWNSTDPTSSVFSFISTANVSGQDFIAYCFAPVSGFSSFGSYEGNGSSDGPFVYTGFPVAFLIVKNVDSSGYNWMIMDSARDIDNPRELYLNTNTSNAEDSTSVIEVDFLSNGFKVNDTWNGFNGSGNTMIYLAFAENPFQANGGLAR